MAAHKTVQALKASGKKAYAWKRCRQSVKGKRNEANFQRDKEYLGSLKRQEDKGEVML